MMDKEGKSPVTGRKLDRSLISDIAPFTDLAPAALDAILGEAQSRLFAEGDTVFSQGEQADNFYVLLHGRLKVVQLTPDGRQIVVRHINPGEMAGIARAVRLPTYPASAIAAVESLCLCWQSSAWDRFSAIDPTITGHVLKLIGERLQETHTRVRELSTQEVERRIAHAVLRLVKQAGRKTDEGILIDFPVTRQDLAEMAGTTLHTVSRLMSGWEEKGLVTSARKKVVVVDPQRLVLLAEGSDD
jgi:CRP-like cAMP-binding protein